MTATQTMQTWIEAKESVATLDYGLRSIKTCRGEWYCTGPHARQLADARREAACILRGDAGQAPAMDARWIREALRQAREWLKYVEQERKAIGGLRQLRLAIAAECDCYGGCGTRLAGGGEYYCDACIATQRAEQGDELANFNAYHEWADQIGAAA